MQSAWCETCESEGRAYSKQQQAAIMLTCYMYSASEQSQAEPSPRVSQHVLAFSRNCA